ncbi:MAG: hypothetical protein IJH37_00400 [Clostridia bacterium]|nr:hypothetical protein [Clostridia bacterium]
MKVFIRLLLKISIVILLVVILVYVVMVLNIKRNAGIVKTLIISHSKNEYFYLDEITPFNWDEVYFLDPYDNSKTIEQYTYKKILYYKPQFSEADMQIMFFYKGIMVCYCYGNGAQNAYYMPWNDFEKFNGKRRSDGTKIKINSQLSSKLGYIYLEPTD